MLFALGLLNAIVSVGLQTSATATQASNTTHPATLNEASLPVADGRLICSEPVYDFGTVWAGTLVRHEFLVANTSSTVVWVELHRITSGTFAKVEFKIPSHGKTAIPIEVQTTSLRGDVSKLYYLTVSKVDPGTKPLPKVRD